MNGRKSQPLDKGKSNDTADDVSALNGTEIKQESTIKLEPEDVGEVVTVSALEYSTSGSIVDLIGQTGDTCDFTDVCKLVEVKSAVKEEKIDKKAKTNSAKASGAGDIGSPLPNDATDFRSKRKQPKPQRSSGGSKKTKKNLAKPTNKTNTCSNKEKPTASKATGKQHKCSSCDYATSKKDHLNKHIRKHTGEKPFPCTHCAKRFTRKENLQSHMRSHASGFLFSCSNCLKGFSKEDEKLEHEISCKIKRYKCNLCKKYSTLIKSHLVAHMRMHTGKKPFPCTLCAKRFTQKTHLRSHLRTHVGEFLFSCPNCLKGFLKEDEKLEHEISCKIRRYECHLCKENSTLHKSHLDYHMRVQHTGEKPFGCDQCSKKFPRQTELKSHLKTHINPRPLIFQCSVCYRNFYQQIEKGGHEVKCKRRGYECYVCKEFTSNLLHNLKCHMRTHTGLKPFQCKLCQKSFTTKSSLERHLKNVHK